jgi:hypothetical protein
MFWMKKAMKITRISQQNNPAKKTFSIPKISHVFLVNFLSGQNQVIKS